MCILGLGKICNARWQFLKISPEKSTFLYIFIFEPFFNPPAEVWGSPSRDHLQTVLESSKNALLITWSKIPTSDFCKRAKKVLKSENVQKYTFFFGRNHQKSPSCIANFRTFLLYSYSPRLFERFPTSLKKILRELWRKPQETYIKARKCCFFNFFQITKIFYMPSLYA